ncbi:antibiotic biosynthesis monooxygenase family protein [Microbispora hainanensis]|uniref:Antibiotic biosynthesis monooxygenase n=1 Tax=Microbispora hainanensis TaxID=568844 RepID=A0A544Z2M9_9ACTN|nr:antibiotic biosynthesis monooxygenase family protein [Microbispora hainanensis]TQS23310.1 antibiotic biosynthesis monooxygenase [Microbispora hainanensis]
MTETAAFRVMLDMRVRPGTEADFERAWLEVARGVARHPANRGQWLSRSPGDESEGTTYYVVTDWTDEPSFREFELSLEHVRNRALLQPYRNGGSMRTMHVVYELVEER